MKSLLHRNIPVLEAVTTADGIASLEMVRCTMVQTGCFWLPRRTKSDSLNKNKKI
jgi:hypothetical protein